MRDLVELKICGITTIADLRIAAQVGASFFGCIVEIPRSPRNVSVQVARYLGRATSIPQVCVVETEDAEWISRVAEICSPAAIQLHPSAGASLEKIALQLPETTELWLAIGIPRKTDAEATYIDEIVARITAAANAGVKRIVLDTVSSSGTGGTGAVNDWQAAAQIVQRSPLPIMLAGGITPANIAEAVQTVHPHGIDVSSGIEQRPGVKDAKKMTELGHQLRQAKSCL